MLSGAAANQTSWIFHPTPPLVHRPGQTLCKQFSRIEWHSVSHDVIRRFCKLVRQSPMGHHPVCPVHLSVKITAGRFIIAPCQLGGFRKGPAKIFVSVFFVPLALLLAIAGPFAVDLSAV